MPDRNLFDDPFSPHPMQKTKKSIAKRFKITGTGKVMRRTPGKRHLLRNKTVKQKRRASKDKSVSPGMTAMIRRAIPTLF